MRTKRRILCVITAAAMLTGLSACGSGGDGTDTAPTTTAATVDINTEGLLEDEAAVLENLMTNLQDYDLENGEVKWLSHYDINPDTRGQSKSVQLEMFEQKYGGSIKWYPTTWDNRYSDLSTMVLGGEGIDIFPGEDVGSLPVGITNEMFQSVDEYIDISSPLWQSVIEGMNLYRFGDKHYQFVTDITAECAVIYSKSTIQYHGLDDPYELWQEGNWNWDTFKSLLLEFVDEENDRYGLDGFWAEKALFLSAGVPFTGTDASGSLVCNVYDPTLERAFNYQYGLFQDGLVFPREQFQWNEQPQFMSEGRQLFYLCGVWTIQGAPETWVTLIDPDDVMLAPVPSPAGSREFQGARLEGYVLCKGAQNPKGAALFAECGILSRNDENAVAIADRKLRDDSKWSEELVRVNKEINELARQNPVLDLSAGCSKDIDSITMNGGDEIGLRAALHGKEWAQTRDESAEVLIQLIGEVDQKIKAKQ